MANPACLPDEPLPRIPDFQAGLAITVTVGIEDLDDNFPDLEDSACLLRQNQLFGSQGVTITVGFGFCRS